MKKPTTINEYISGFPADIQKKLEQFRTTVKKAAPLSEEVISYGIPRVQAERVIGLVWRPYIPHRLLSARFSHGGI